MLKIKDYVIVHAGFAIERLDPEKAKETLRLVNEIH
jgi:hydrogenase maturation factor